MEIREIQEKSTWEDFLFGVEEKTFLQSWNWGEFQRKSGNKIWRFGVFSGGSLIAVFLTVKIIARRGVFLFVPHGPLPVSLDEETVGIIAEKLKSLGKEEGAVFVRIASLFPESSELLKDFRNSPIHMHPELSWELGLESSEEELLGGMRKTTRYLIRQAEKNPDIEIEKAIDPSFLTDFEKAYEDTVKRHHFTPFSRKYLELELESFKEDNQIMFFLGKYRGEIASAAMVVFWSNGAFYHQGASVTRFQRFPVSYLLQWEAIKEAKKRGCRFYNFWGISDINNKRHPWFGLSQFKMGFGGYEKRYLKTKDLPLSSRYWLTYVFEIIRKHFRHL